MPAFFGLGGRINRVLADWYAGGASDGLEAEPFSGAAGLSAFDVEYLKALSARPGAPVMMVGPDVLPEEWRQLD